jgi:hypothetical protein
MSLRALALVSAVYDLLLALPLLLAPAATARLFGAPPPQPVINGQLNGMFTLALAVGYFWAARDVEQRRGYLWVAGVLAKGLGSLLLVLDHVLRDSPASFLLFAGTDGALALLTLVLLMRASPASADQRAPLASTAGPARAGGNRPS